MNAPSQRTFAPAAALAAWLAVAGGITRDGGGFGAGNAPQHSGGVEEDVNRRSGASAPKQPPERRAVFVRCALLRSGEECVWSVRRRRVE